MWCYCLYLQSTWSGSGGFGSQDPFASQVTGTDNVTLSTSLYRVVVQIHLHQQTYLEEIRLVETIHFHRMPLQIIQQDLVLTRLQHPPSAITIIYG